MNDLIWTEKMYKGYSKKKAAALMRAKELDANVIGDEAALANSSRIGGPTKRVIKRANANESSGWFFGISQARKLLGGG
ncbi:MAG: hypothetical protein JAY75_08185 [Candidatus Thiodiazotropha taylori]|nr:hypothetical protein [Candidatus Thiodiazotropha taylori]MCG8094905.1 hypothetical protein [Candidatus Thiodiazotropha endolucinida]MCG7880816.1 hypothetical protein [Candidatus Thiodiazotropha taylori]MCG7884569.1 hypothetical protein [Candidatus Thiodiazotropha taylori]MCG7889033.1 hypothetical protein [Candidatus Thiodiazotropha taylori]